MAKVQRKEAGNTDRCFPCFPSCFKGQVWPDAHPHPQSRSRPPQAIVDPPGTLVLIDL